MSTEAHRTAAGRPSLRVAVLTLSDTRTPETDQGGQLIRQLLAANGHAIVYYAVLKDDPGQLRAAVQELAERGDVHAVLTTGGTGVSRRDSTFEALAGLLEKRLDGFGELFRMLSYQEVGAAAMLSRATAGVFRGVLIFSMPGSVDAARLAMEKLILPELPHLVLELAKQS
jgi:molybdenum cofactor biosynthesis protein B